MRYVWDIVCQVPLSVEFSRQEYRSRLPFPSPGDLPNPGIEPESPALQEDSLPTELQGKHNMWNTIQTLKTNEKILVCYK